MTSSPNTTVITSFLDPGELIDGELSLVVTELAPADPEREYVPTYKFAITVDGRTAGLIDLRLGATESLVLYGGQIGYRVEEPHRGRRLAARSVRLLAGLARRHEFDELWITCNPENAASRRTCELAGAELVEIVELPRDNEMYARGERRKCRYRLPL